LKINGEEDLLSKSLLWHFPFGKNADRTFKTVEEKKRKKNPTDLHENKLIISRIR